MLTTEEVEAKNLARGTRRVRQHGFVACQNAQVLHDLVRHISARKPTFYSCRFVLVKLFRVHTNTACRHTFVLFTKYASLAASTCSPTFLLNYRGGFRLGKNCSSRLHDAVDWTAALVGETAEK